MATFSSISANTGASGASITITGLGFGSQGAGGVSVGGVPQTIVSWNDTTIVFSIAADDTMGDVVVQLNSQVYCGPFFGPGQA
jgi:hypothetical protein